VDFTFLKEFLTEEVAKQYLPAERCALFNRFLRLFHNTFATPGSPGPQEGLVVAMQLLVIPMLTDTLEQPFAREVRRTDSLPRTPRSMSPWYFSPSPPLEGNRALLQVIASCVRRRAHSQGFRTPRRV